MQPMLRRQIRWFDRNPPSHLRQREPGALRDVLAAAVSVDGKPARLRSVVRRLVWPGPATELGGLIVGESVLDLALGVHHERAVLRHRLSDRSALKDHDLDAFGPSTQLGYLVGLDQRTGSCADLGGTDRNGRSFERIQRTGGSLSCHGELEARVGFHGQVPDSHVGSVTRSPTVGRRSSGLKISDVTG